VVGVLEIYLGIDTCFLRGVQKVIDERKQITVFLGDSVETMEIHTESE
jgi:hypothetical protein